MRSVVQLYPGPFTSTKQLFDFRVGELLGFLEREQDSLLLIPELFSDALARNDFSMTNATVSVMTLLMLVFLTSLVSFRFRRADRVLGGEPIVLVHDGRFLEPHMSRERVTAEDVIAEVHKAGLEELRQVR